MHRSAPNTNAPPPTDGTAGAAEDARMRALVAHAGVGIAELDLDGAFTLVNPAVCVLTGYPETELRQRRLADLIHPDDLLGYGARFAAAVATGTSVVDDLRYVRPDGSTVLRSTRVSVMRDRDNHPQRVVLVVTDRTARTEAEQAVRASEATYRTLFESIDEGFCVFEMVFDDAGTPVDYRFVETNAVFERHTGLANAVGKTARELVPSLEAHWFDIYGAVALTGEARRFEQHAAAMGDRWFEVYASRVGGTDSRTVALVFKDITARKQAEEALRDSHARRAFVLEAAKIGEWELDLATGQGQHSLIHDQCFGATKPFPDWSYDHFLGYVHPDDRAAVARTFGDAIHAQHAWNFECRVVWADTSVHWIQAQGHFYGDGTLSPSRMVGIVTDITERKQAEAAIVQLSQRNREILESITDAFFALDHDWRFIYVNQQAERMLHRAPGDLLGKQLWTEYPDLVGSAFERAYRQAATAGSSETVTAWYPNHARWYEVHVYPGAQGITVYFRNVTEQKWAEEERERLLAAEQAARVEAEAAVQTREQFLSIASHELRTPLTSLLGYASLLSKAAAHDTGKVAQMSARIVRQAERLNGLIDQLLDVTRLQRGQFLLARRPVNLAVLVGQVVDEVHATFPATSTHTVTVTAPDAAVLVDGDVERLEQVLHNLLSNAIKYSPEGGTVQVQVASTATEAVVEVTDQGIGIPADAQAHLFEPFYRAPTIGGQASGFGLGLHIVREIVARHGGRIEVDSTEGVGSTFRVVLPLHMTEARIAS